MTFPPAHSTSFSSPFSYLHINRAYEGGSAFVWEVSMDVVDYDGVMVMRLRLSKKWESDCYGCAMEY